MVAKEDEKKHLYTSCSAWYETPAGQFALQKLKDKMGEELSEIFGYFALEAGALLNQYHFLDESRVSTCFSLGSHVKEPSIIADMEALPLDFDSVDLVIANHVLECSADPHQVLREIDRVLVADGHCFFIGFNPLSLWHKRQSFCDPTDSNSSVNDPSGSRPNLSSPQLYGVRRVRDWISLLGWKVNKISYVSFRAKFMKGKLFERLDNMEKWGSLYWPIFGNLYIIHAQKQVLNMTPKKRRKREWDGASVLPPKVAINAINPAPRSTQTREHK